MTLDVATLAECTGATFAAAEKYCWPLNEAMERFALTSPRVASVLLGQVAIESDHLAAVEEGLYYRDPARLRLIFPSLFNPAKGGKYRAEDYVRDPVKLGQLRYAGYWGRGLIQLTWQDTYRAASAALGFDYIGNPGLVVDPRHAALTACWFFAAYKGCIPAAERGDVFDVTGRVNGPARLKLAERKAVTAHAYGVLSK